MKLLYIPMLNLFALNALYAEAPLIFLDGIEVAIYGVPRTDIITHSELRRPGIDGNVRTKDDLINQYLKAQDAVRYGMKATSEAVDKQLEMIFKNNHMTEDDFNKMLQAAGYLPEEGREEFARLTDVSQIEGFKIYGQLIVPERDIIAHYNEHPEYEEAAYEVEHAVIPYDFSQERQEQCAHLDTNNLEWTEPFWVNEQDIADDKAFIRTLPFNTISEPRESSFGFEFIRVRAYKEKKLIPLEKRRLAIIDTLRQPMLQEKRETYHKELREHATILDFSAEHEKSV